MIATPSEQFRMLRLVDAETPAFLVMCVCSAAYVVARERFCSLCGALIDPAKGDLYDTAAPAARASVDDEPKAAEFDCVGIGERILARRVAAQISLSTLGDELAIRADRLCRYEQGKVEDGEMAELLRALVWSAGYDSAVVDAYRKPKSTEAAHG